MLTNNLPHLTHQYLTLSSLGLGSLNITPYATCANNYHTAAAMLNIKKNYDSVVFVHLCTAFAAKSTKKYTHANSTQ